MRPTTYETATHALKKAFEPSGELLGIEQASWLFYVGGGCLIIVFIFGIILCRLDISSGDRRRRQSFHVVES